MEEMSRIKWRVCVCATCAKIKKIKNVEINGEALSQSLLFRSKEPTGTVRNWIIMFTLPLDDASSKVLKSVKTLTCKKELKHQRNFHFQKDNCHDCVIDCL